MKKKRSGFEVLGMLVAILVAVIITSITRGLVLEILWGWFVQPLGVASINVAEAIGLAVLVGMLVQRAPEDESKDSRSPTTKFVAAFIASVLGAGTALLLGWLVHFFV